MTYSEHIKDLLEGYGNKLEKDSLIIDCRRELPIDIGHISDIKTPPVRYRPELYYVRKKDRRFITFQAFDTQPIKAIIGDVFCAFFTTQIIYAYFFVKNNKKLNKINELISIIESRLLRDFKAKRYMFPTCSAVLIREKDIQNKKLFVKKLNELASKYKW